MRRIDILVDNMKLSQYQSGLIFDLEDIKRGVMGLKPSYSSSISMLSC